MLATDENILDLGLRINFVGGKSIGTVKNTRFCDWNTSVSGTNHTRVGTLIVAILYLQLIQNRYMLRSFTVLHCSHQHCVQPVASDVEVVGYL